MGPLDVEILASFWSLLKDTLPAKLLQIWGVDMVFRSRVGCPADNLQNKSDCPSANISGCPDKCHNINDNTMNINFNCFYHCNSRIYILFLPIALRQTAHSVAWSDGHVLDLSWGDPVI